MDLITQDDILRMKALKKVIDEGQFDIKGNAVAPVGALFRWFQELDKRMENTVRFIKENEFNVKRSDPIKVEEKAE